MKRIRSVLSIPLAAALALTALFCSEDPASPDDLREELLPHGSVAGVVCNTRGEPLRGVLVAANADSSIPDVTDSLGQFTIGYVANGTHTLRFTHRDWEDSAVSVTVGEGEDVVLDDTVTLRYAWYLLRGTVTHQGQPVLAAGVGVAGTDVSALTDSDGVFILPRVPKLDSIKLLCVRDPLGFGVSRLSTELVEGDTTDVDSIALAHTGGTVQGTVYDLNGFALPWVVVSVAGGGSYATTDVEGRYVLHSVPTGDPDVRISIVTRDSTLAGSVSGISVDTAGVTTGVDIYLHRLTDFVNGMALNAENTIVADTADEVLLRCHVACDATTRVENWLWHLPDTTLTTSRSACTAPLALLRTSLAKTAGHAAASTATVKVQARNTAGTLSAAAELLVSVQSVRPSIALCGVAVSETGRPGDSVLVNVGHQVFLAADIRAPMGGIDSCWWSFGDGYHVATEGVFIGRVSHVYATAAHFRPVLRVRDIYGHELFDTVVVEVNTPPQFDTAQILPTAACIDDTLRLALSVLDSDSDAVRLDLLQSPPGVSLSGRDVVWAPAQTDTGMQRIVVRADDSRGGADTLAWNLLVTTMPATDAALQSILLSAGALSPSFDSAVTTYTVVMPSTITYYRVKPLPHSPNATLAVRGQPLPQGMYSDWYGLDANTVDTVVIEVTAQDRRTTQTYTLYVSRDQGRNARLSRLEIYGERLVPAFDPEITAYVDSVAAEQRYIQLTAWTADPSATLRLDGDELRSGESRWVTLADSSHDTLEVVVTAEDTTVQTIYRVTIVRRPSANAFLSRLEWEHASGAAVFHPETTLYADTVPGTICSTRVLAVVDGEGTLTVAGTPVSSGAWSAPIVLRGGENVIPVEVTAADSVSRKVYTLVIERELGSDARLLSLTSPSAFTPAYAAGTVSYADTVEFEQDTYQLRALAADPNATVIIAGDTVGSDSAHGVPLSDGTTAIGVTLISEDAAERLEVQLLVTRKADVALAALGVSSGALVPAFHPESLSYRVDVENEVESVRLTPTLRAPSTTTVSVNGAEQSSGILSDPISLVTGANTVTVRCAGVDGISNRTYTVTVTRKPSTNALLQALTVTEGALTPSFDPDTLVYRDTVDQTINAIRVTATTAHSAARVTVNGSPVSSGSLSPVLPLDYYDDTIRVVVTAHDSVTQKTYTVYVYRRPNTNANLCSLSVSGVALTPSFDSLTASYSATVPWQTARVVVTSRPANPGATIAVNGVSVPGNGASDSLALVAGVNAIDVIVTAMDQVTSKTYSIAITRMPRDSLVEGLLVTGDDTLRAAHSPYHLTNSIYVSPDAQLVIEPGVTLLLDGGVSIDVHGTLIARGTAQDSIVLRRYGTSYWGYVRFHDGATDAHIENDTDYVGGSVLAYCVFERGGSSSITAGCVHIDSCSMLLSHCSIRYSCRGGLAARLLTRDTLRVHNTVFDNNYKGISHGCGAGIMYNAGAACMLSGYNTGGLNVAFLGCAFVNNRGGSGGGCGRNWVANGGPHVTGIDTLRMERCRFENNSGGSHAVYLQVKTAIIRDCVFENNTTGTLTLEEGSSASRSVVERCLFSGNRDLSVSYAGYAPLRTRMPNVTLRQCLFDANVGRGNAVVRIERQANSLDSVYANTFVNNVLSDSANYAYPGMLVVANAGGVCHINENAFLENTGRALLSYDAPSGSPALDAGGNYWNTTDQNQVNSLIYDYFDNNALPIVNTAPLLSSTPVRAPTPGWSPLSP